jgi:hypothetical protein
VLNGKGRKCYLKLEKIRRKSSQSKNDEFYFAFYCYLFMHKLDLMLMKVANPSLNPDHIFSPAVQMGNGKDDKNLNYSFPLYENG